MCKVPQKTSLAQIGVIAAVGGNDFLVLTTAEEKKPLTDNIYIFNIYLKNQLKEHKYLSLQECNLEFNIIGYLDAI